MSPKPPHLGFTPSGTRSKTITTTAAIGTAAPASSVTLRTNRAPVLPEPINRTIGEGTVLAVTNAASDPDLPADALAYSLEDPPTGAVIDTNGVVAWTPSEAQGPGGFTLTTIVADNGTPQLKATNSLAVTVNEVNAATVLSPVGNRTANEGEPLSFIVAAADPNDAPANQITLRAEALPPGAAFDALTGVFSWTPGPEQQGNHAVTFIATDDGSPPLNEIETMTISVGDVNRPPILPRLPDASVWETTMLRVTNTAADPDLPAQSVSYTLLSAPEGMSISADGIVDWTPSETDGPATNTILTVASDDGTPRMAVTNTFTVVVLESNSPPVLTVPPDITIQELRVLNLTNHFDDLDRPANPLIFAVISGPSNLTVSTEGWIHWTPTEAQGPGTNTVVISLSDTNPSAVNARSLSATGSFEIVVTEVNQAPDLAALNDYTVNPGQPINFQALAADADLPINALSFELISPPPGAAIDPASGWFSWRPPVVLAGTTNSIQVEVLDDGLPALNVQRSFNVIVNPLDRPRLTPVGFSDTQFQVRVSGTFGPDYVVLASSNLVDWCEVFTLASPDTPFLFTDPAAGSLSNRVFRVRLSP